MSAKISHQELLDTVKALEKILKSLLGVADVEIKVELPEECDDEVLLQGPGEAGSDREAG